MTTYVYIYVIFFENLMIFDNANGIQVVDLEKSFRMR